jgi:hypothetical protein
VANPPNPSEADETNFSHVEITLVHTDNAKVVDHTRSGTIPEHRIDYRSERLTELMAQGPFDNHEREDHRQDSIRLEINTFVFHHKKTAEHREVLAGLPPQE